MKNLKILIPIIFISAWLGSCQVDQKNPEMHPGFDEQYRMMKTNENGEIPRGLWRKWKSQSARLDKAGFFKDVRELGPSNVGGRVRALIIDKANSSRLLAGGITGGVWESINSGNSWAPINDHEVTLSVSSLTQNPFNHSEIYYSTGEASTSVIAISGNGIFKSTDGGKSFNFLEASDIPAFDHSWEILHSTVFDKHIYIGTRSHGLYRSRDGGLTFNQIYQDGNRGVNDVLVRSSDSTVIFTVQNAGIYIFHETEDDPSPVKLTNGLPTGSFRRVQVSHSENNQNTVYSCFGNSAGDGILGIYKSEDGGNNWVETGTSGLSGISLDLSWYALMFKVHPDNPDFVVIGAQEAGFSRNGGSSWQALEEGHVDYHITEFVPNSDVFYVGNDGGIYRYNTSSAGSTVSDRNSNFNVTQWFAGDYFPVSEGDRVIAGAQDNNTRINTAGLAYSTVLGGDGAFCEVSEDGTMYYASSQNAQIRRNRNGSWTNIYWGLANVAGVNGFHFINPFGINEIDADQIFFPTTNYLVRSANAGTTWELATAILPGNMYCVGITPEDNPTVYIGGAGNIFHRVDKALTAEPGDHHFFSPAKAPIEAKGFIGCIEIDPTNHSTIYLAYTNVSTLPRIWRIQNADTEFPVWKDISSNLPEELPVNWIEVDPNNSNYIMIGTDYGLYTSTNGGLSWGKDATVPNVPVFMVRFRPEDRKLFAFTHGRGTWVAEMEDVITSVEETSAFKELRIWPNPALNVLHVDLSFTEDDIDLFNVQGQRVNVSSSGNGIDVSNLKSGTYFGQIKSEGQTHQLKFTKQ